MTKTFSIANRPVGRGHPPYVVAELSANHNGSIERAMELMNAARAAGADAVKLQTYTADTMTIDHDSSEFQIKGGLWDGRSLYDLYREAHTPWEWHEPLFRYGEKLGLAVFSTPFDFTAVSFLESLKAPAYKIASFEVTDLPLIRKTAATGKPLVISTGMASLGEIADAVAAARESGGGELILLHCISGYPTPAEEANLRTMANLAETFDVAIGLSDHTMGTAVSVAAVALGACLIEKHFTLRRADGGVDSAFSLEPQELADLVAGCRIAHAALGKVNFDLMGSEAANMKFRRSLYVVRDIAAGEALSEENIQAIRPGYGLSPRYRDDVMGRRAAQPLARGTALRWDMLRQDSLSD
jgi:pseudaminic acid synthase